VSGGSSARFGAKPQRNQQLAIVKRRPVQLNCLQSPGSAGITLVYEDSKLARVDYRSSGLFLCFVDAVSCRRAAALLLTGRSSPTLAYRLGGP